MPRRVNHADWNAQSPPICPFRLKPRYQLRGFTFSPTGRDPSRRCLNQPAPASEHGA
jgi:hypothetical protein